MILRTHNEPDQAMPRARRVIAQKAFTLLEVMVVTVLLSILVISSAAGLISLDRSSRRMADFTAAAAVAEAKMHSIRAASYNPPAAPFGSSNVFFTNTSSIALSKSGTNYLVTGTVISMIQPVSAGHLVTVTANFSPAPRPITVTLQTIVNRFTTGEQ